MVEIKKIECYSGKLKKEILLEAYTSQRDDQIIITATSLKEIFESIKEEFGITDSISSDVRVNENGNITYASVEWTLKDKSGYNSTFVGEATPASLSTPIAKQYPKLTAYNRALSIGIKTYLQIPKNVYTNDEIPINSNSENKKPEISEKKEDIIQPAHISDLSSMPVKKTTAANSIAAKLANTEPKSGLIGSIITAPEFNEDNSDFSDDSFYTETQEKYAKESKGDIVTLPKETDVSKKSVDINIDDNSKIPVGVFAGKTIRELFDDDGPVSRSFIQMCVLHQIKDSDANKMAVIDYIAKKAGEENNH